MSEWISVKQELPPMSKAMILADSQGRVAMGWLRDLGVGYTGKASRWYFDHHPSNGITHWMPLPAPPEAE